MVPSKLRRLGLFSIISGFFLVVMLTVPMPDVSMEKELLDRLADLSVRLQYAESLNDIRRTDLASLYKQFSSIMEALKDGKRWREDEFRNLLRVESEALFHHSNWTYDLGLPSISHFLPHTVNHPNAFIPDLKIAPAVRSRQSSSLVSLVLGIPTVKREHQSYLHTTLKSLLDNMSPQDKEDTLIIIFIAETTDRNFVTSTASEIQRQFPDAIKSGLLEIISPPAEYYPDLSKLKQTLGDDLQRVQWRTKQNLDYAFLMMYASWRGVFYVQLEDDILTKPGFISTMKDFALEKVAAKDQWFILDFCQLGFIGKLVRSVHLPILIQFFVMFYNDKPVDWLLESIIQTMVCKYDQDYKKCKKEKDKVWLHYKRSLFQHIGTHSSLKGKVQKLKDKRFGKVQLFVPHKNPTADIDTNIKHYNHYSLTRAYRGETFFWGLVPQKGDVVQFKFTPPTALELIRFVSGNAEHPSDRFIGTSVDISTSSKASDEDYERLGEFDSNGVFEKNVSNFGVISRIRLNVHANSDNWAILNEIYFKTRT